MSDNWNMPWEKRGFGLYLPSTNKKVLEVTVAWKTSEQAQEIIDIVAHRINQFDAMFDVLNQIAAGEGNARALAKAAINKAVRP